jgi:signal transduction histidine kinase/CheY-like chemotaxis protein
MDLAEKLIAERRARLAAERLLELKSRELFAANRKLAEHARALSDEIATQRQVVASAETRAEALAGENQRVRSDLQRVARAQELAERRLWDALETIRDGFAIYGPDRRLIIANRAYLSVFDGLDEVGPGAAVDDILRIGLEEGVFDPGDEPTAAWRARLVARWDAEAPEPCVIRLWNGRHIRLQDRRAADGGIVSLALDITGTIRREARLREARRRAEAGSRAKSSFLARMSHELRTPMNGVMGMAELLCETRLSDEQRLYAETIRSSAEALLSIINDVLDYSKLEAQRLELHPEPFDLERLIHEILISLSPAAAAKGLELGLDYDLFLPARLVGDRGRLRQVLTNLIGNAVKFTERGHVTVRVVGMEAGLGRHRVHFAVEDTGIGIPEAMREHIFGEFNQVEDERNRKFDGTGLGLSIARELVRLMGGDIWVDSELGKGSCFGFAIELPRAPGAQPAPPRLPGRLRSVLVVAGNAVVRALMERQLQALGLAVTVAAAPEEVPRAGIGWQAVLTDRPLPAGTPGAGLPTVFIARDAAEAGAAAGGGWAAVLCQPVLRGDLLSALAALAPQVAEPPAASGRLRLLAAEDNRTNQLVFSRMLKDQPIDVAFAANGREAVERFAAEPFDIVFMDISMPEMDGREATRAIRAIEAREGRGRTPIVALTAHAMEGDAAEILSAGLDRHLPKPLRKAAILEAIAEFCPGFAAVPAAEEAARAG